MKSFVFPCLVTIGGITHAFYHDYYFVQFKQEGAFMSMLTV